MHKDDIMTVCYDSLHLILWTGAHDGALFGWNTETGTAKYRLHECDTDCMVAPGGNHIAQQKSIDCLTIMVIPDKEETESSIMINES
jgi:WD40 repeat protein